MPKVSRRLAAAEASAPAGYTPPANAEAEQSVLGAILVRPEVMDRIADMIIPEDFYREAHGRIYKAMLDLYGKGEPVDLVTVSALLKERGQLEGVGGPAFLAGLSEQVGFAANADYYANLGRFISFKKLVKPSEIVEAKLFCVRLEKRLAIVGKRRINIDPGYLNEAKVVLSTTKDFSHRIYLGKKIFAEVTLIYRDKAFRNLAWTFPDYKTKPYKEILAAIRNLYKENLKKPGK